MSRENTTNPNKGGRMELAERDGQSLVRQSQTARERRASGPRRHSGLVRHT